MERRQALVIGVAGGLLGIGGCLDRALTSSTPVSGGTEPDEDGGTTDGERTVDGPYELVSFTASSERTAPEHRYTVELVRIYDSVGDEHAVVELEALPSKVRAVLQEAKRERYAADDLPEGTRTAIEEYDFVDFGNDARERYLGFELLEVDLERPPRLAVDATLLDDVATADDPAVFELEAENTGDEPIEWRTAPPRPFGIPRADDLLLWTDAYEESPLIATDDGELGPRKEPLLIVELQPGESVIEEYEVQPDRDGFKPGEYSVDGTLTAEFEGGFETVSYELRWTVEELDE